MPSRNTSPCPPFRLRKFTATVLRKGITPNAHVSDVRQPLLQWPDYLTLSTVMVSPFALPVTVTFSPA